MFDYERNIWNEPDFRFNLLAIKTKEIPELIEVYKTLKHDEITKPEWSRLAANPHTWDIFYNYITSGDFTGSIKDFAKYISLNTAKGAIEYMGKNIKLFANCPNLYSNPSAYSIIIQLIRNMNPEYAKNLCSNTNPDVIALLRSYPDLISQRLSANPTDAAIDILLADPTYISYSYLSANTNPRVVPLLKANYDKLDKTLLSANPIIFPVDKFTPRFVERIRQIYTKLVEKMATALERKSRELRSPQNQI